MLSIARWLPLKSKVFAENVAVRREKRVFYRRQCHQSKKQLVRCCDQYVLRDQPQNSVIRQLKRTVTLGGISLSYEAAITL